MWKIFLVLLLMLSTVGAQDFFAEFGYCLPILKGLSPEGIIQAGYNGDAATLGGYASLFLYAERLTGKVSEFATGTELLEEATKIAFANNDIRGLTVLSNLWEDSMFGASNVEASQNIRKNNVELVMEPAYQKVKPGETLVFRVFFKIKLVHVVEIPIPLDQLLFYSPKGTFKLNEYVVPNTSEVLWLSVTHRSTRKVAYSILSFDKDTK